MNQQIQRDTIVRTAILALALVNQFLTIMGKSPLPIRNDELTQFISYLLTFSSAVWAWWKNNSFTKEAIKADQVLNKLKNEGDDSGAK